MTQTREGLAPGPCLPKGQRLQAALYLLPTPPHLDPGGPGIIALHVQELIHVNLQFWDLFFLGWQWGRRARQGPESGSERVWS